MQNEPLSGPNSKLCAVHFPCKSPTDASSHDPTPIYIYTSIPLLRFIFWNTPLPFRQDKGARACALYSHSSLASAPARLPRPRFSITPQATSPIHPPRTCSLLWGCPESSNSVGLPVLLTRFDLADDFLGVFPFLFRPPFQQIGWRGCAASSIWKIWGGGKRRIPRPEQQVGSFLGQHFGGICGGSCLTSWFLCLVSFFLWCDVFLSVYLQPRVLVWR